MPYNRAAWLANRLADLTKPNHQHGSNKHRTGIDMRNEKSSNPQLKRFDIKLPTLNYLSSLVHLLQEELVKIDYKTKQTIKIGVPLNINDRKAALTYINRLINQALNEAGNLYTLTNCIKKSYDNQVMWIEITLTSKGFTTKLYKCAHCGNHYPIEQMLQEDSTGHKVHTLCVHCYRHLTSSEMGLLKGC